MEVQTFDTDEGKVVEINSQGKVALVIQRNGEERILLPEHRSGESYYVEDPDTLVETEKGYRAVLNQYDDFRVLN